MNLYEVLFMGQFVVFLLLFLLKLFNLLSVGKLYKWKASTILFISTLLAYFVAFSIFMLHPEILIYLVLFRLQTALMPFHVLFLILELVFILKDVGKPKQAYKSNAAGTQ